MLGAGCGRAARTGPVASRLAPLAMRRSRQSSLPLRAAYMRAVLPACGGAATAAHAISAGGKRAGGGSTGMADGEGGVCGRGYRGVGGGWRGGAHLICGVHVGALGNEALEAIELAVNGRIT